MEHARALYREGAPKDADPLWQAAHDIAQSFADNDPRRAASLDALGTLAAANGDRELGEELYNQALATWSAAHEWVFKMNLAQAARSSTFHQRLESKHPGAYPDMTRMRHAKTCAAGRANAEANLAFVTGVSGSMRDAWDMRRGAFGRRESVAAAMAATLGEMTEGRIIDRWAERPPVGYDDERRLYAAALLAPRLVPPDEG